MFYTGYCKARFFNQPESALYLNFMMIVNAVITPMTQQILSQYYFYFGLHNCIFKKVGSVFDLYVTAMFLLHSYIPGTQGVNTSLPGLKAIVLGHQVWTN